MPVSLQECFETQKSPENLLIPVILQECSENQKSPVWRLGPGQQPRGMISPNDSFQGVLRGDYRGADGVCSKAQITAQPVTDDILLQSLVRFASKTCVKEFTTHWLPLATVCMTVGLCDELVVRLKGLNTAGYHNHNTTDCVI